MGDLVASIDHYTDIPADVRAQLAARMARRDYDDIAVIRRDAIAGRDEYDPAIRDMHFGTNRLCSTVSRTAWPADREERGLVYCVADQCVIVPTVCRNVSRVTRRAPAVAAVPVAGDADELVYAPPAAGPTADDAMPGSFESPDAAPSDVADGGGPLVPLPAPIFVPIPGPIPGPVPTPIVIDHRLIPSVPEPATWLSMTLGFGLIGMLARARSRWM